ncbi:PAS domain-containing protein, partial [Geminicoccus flavidas]|uniref:PAS domain-containing protein n=1 Tax=Geminicoccus flavidas TaxID=2506407 RepID=UPI00135BF66E
PGMPASTCLQAGAEFFAAADVATFEHDLAAGLLRLSRAAVEMVGIGSEHCVDVADHDRSVHADDLDRLRAERRRAAERGGPFQFAYRMVRPRDGRVICLEARGTALRQPASGGVTLGGILWDVTAARAGDSEVAALCRALSMEVAALTRLHRLSGRLAACTRLEPLLEQVLDAAMALQDADLGVLRLYEPEHRTLRIAAQRGFDQAVVDEFRVLPVTGRMLVVVRAFNTRRRIAVEDITRDTDPLLDKDRARELGIRGAQAIPLIDGGSRPLGVLSAYFRAPMLPSASDLHHLDLFVTQAAEAIGARLDEPVQQLAVNRLRAGWDAIPQPVWQADAAGAWIWASRDWQSLTGQTADVSAGAGWLDALHPDDRARIGDALGKARGTDRFEADLRLWHAAEGHHRWSRMRAEPLPDEAGGPAGWVGITVDIDDLHGRQERQQHLMEQLQHQLRNTLAVVRSIARRTAESASNLQDLAAHLDGRIGALARVQAAVTRFPGRGVDLQGLIDEELLASHVRQSSRLQVVGPPVRLKGKAAEALGLAIHELVTNALEHGALFSPDGRIMACWSVEGASPEGRLHFVWEELSGGNPQPGPEGFGMLQLKRGLVYELRAEVEVDFRPDGIRCDLRIPLSAGIVPDDPPGEAGGMAPAGIAS